MAPPDLEPGATLSGTFRVLPSDLASEISPDPNDVYAKVFATPRLISFMEIVCSRMLVPFLAPGQMSVGVRVDVTHTAATPPDVDVVVTAKFLGREGINFVFEVSARDPAGEVGKGRHVRAFIEMERLYAGARKRMGAASKL